MAEHLLRYLLRVVAQMSKRPKNTHAHFLWERNIGKPQEVIKEASQYDSLTEVALGEYSRSSSAVPTSPKIFELRARYEAALATVDDFEMPKPTQKKHMEMLND